jgi:O-antigen ligase
VPRSAVSPPAVYVPTVLLSPSLQQWAERLQLTLLLALLAACFFLQSGAPPTETIFFWLSGGLAITLLPRIAVGFAAARVDGRPRPGALAWGAILPYAAYAVWWLIASRVHPGSQTTQELGRQAVFLIVLASLATVRRPAVMLAAVMACLCLTAEQILGPRSVESFAGRFLHYRGLEQWSGYPEIGLLMSIGAAASLALLASPALPLRAAALLFAAIFSAGTVALFTRSAMLTVALAAGWLLLLGVFRFRSRIAIGLLLLMAVGAGAAATQPRVAQAIQAFVRLEGWETNTRADGWRVAVSMMRDHPLTGVGPTRYPEAYANYSSGPDRAHAYNLFLHNGAELGIVGLLIVVWMWARVLIVTARAADTRLPGLGALAAHGMLAAFLIRSQSEHFLANLPASFRMLLLLGFLFGLAEGFGRQAAPRVRAGFRATSTSSSPASAETRDTSHSRQIASAAPARSPIDGG